MPEKKTTLTKQSPDRIRNLPALSDNNGIASFGHHNGAGVSIGTGGISTREIRRTAMKLQAETMTLAR
jgi:hypothetical protein